VATLVWLGDMYLDQGRSEAAELLFAKALSLQPGSVAALFGLGRAALARGDHVKAVEHLEKALSLDRQATIIHYSLAMAYRGRGDLQRAEAHVRQRGAGEIRPPDPLMQEVDSMLRSAVAFEVQGAKALDEGDWAAAAAYFRKGIALAPNEPSPRHKLGTALFLAGDARGAAEQFEEALRLSPTFPKAHYSLGIMMGSSGRLEKAIEHLSAAVTYDPSYVEARLRLADVLRQSGRPEESLLHYAQVVKSDPRVADAPFGYALALVRLKRYQEARDRFTEGMTVYPEHPGFAHALVRLLAAAPDDRVRDGRRAMELLRPLFGKEPPSIEASEMMAMTLAELGQYAEASKWQRDAMAVAKRAGRRDLVDRLTDNLKLYERQRPCRTPWRDDAEPGPQR
jgi:tetratricopeptide (TPR) repeat protein